MLGISYTEYPLTVCCHSVWRTTFGKWVRSIFNSSYFSQLPVTPKLNSHPHILSYLQVRLARADPVLKYISIVWEIGKFLS